MLIKADKIVDDMHLLLVNDCQQYAFPVTHKSNLKNKCLNLPFSLPCPQGEGGGMAGGGGAVRCA